MDRITMFGRQFAKYLRLHAISICCCLCCLQASLSLQERRAEELAALERQRRLDEILRQKKERDAAEQFESITDQEMVDDIFGFLPSLVAGQEGQAPVGFEVRDQTSQKSVMFG